MKRILAYAWLISAGSTILATVIFLCIHFAAARALTVVMLGIIAFVFLTVMALVTVLGY